MNSAGIGGREASERKHHLYLALKNDDTFITWQLQVGKGKQFLQRGRKYLVLFHYVEKAVNSLLLTCLNDANVERWANIRDQKETVKASREQGTLEESDQDVIK